MKAWLKKVGRGVLAAITSPTAVQAEKSLWAMYGARILMSIGASAAFVAVVDQVVKALGG